MPKYQGTGAFRITKRDAARKAPFAIIPGIGRT